MEYSSISPIDDRFEFKMKGSFRCAFDSERVIFLAFAISILSCAVGIVICLVINIIAIGTPVDIEKIAESLTQNKDRNFFPFDVLEFGIV